MSLSSLSFIGIYFPVLFLAYYFPRLAKSQKYRNAILLLTSVGFYAAAEPVYIFLLLFSVVFNYKMVDEAISRRQKSFIVAAIVFDVAVLVFFKYINQLCAAVLLSKSLSLAFPIGLSYFTFQEISYCVDSWKAEGKIRNNFWDTALFICNFMRIVSGPIGFYNQCIEEIRHRDSSWGDIYAGIERFAIGLIKKIIIADSLQPLVTVCFATEEHGVLMAWAGAVAFTLELYFDFSGYSDMAIGIGRVFGFHINENFNFPYTAVSVSDFWKRWHMSLTKWFTRYLYIDFLGGSHVSEKKHIFNLFIVWLCTGLWHGSGLTFVIWGMVYFVLQVMEKYTGFDKKLGKLHLARIYTLLVVVLCWVIFRSPDTGFAFRYIAAMFGWGSPHVFAVDELPVLRLYWIPLLAGFLLALPVGRNFIVRMNHNRGLNCLGQIIIVISFIAALVLVIGKGYSAPLYAGF